jgi:hypothetical protein
LTVAKSDMSLLMISVNIRSAMPICYSPPLSGGSTGPDSLFVVGQLSIGAATLNAERPCRTALALPGGLLCTFLPATYNVLGSLISFFSGIAVRL